MRSDIYIADVTPFPYLRHERQTVEHDVLRIRGLSSELDPIRRLIQSQPIPIFSITAYASVKPVARMWLPKIRTSLLNSSNPQIVIK